MLAICGNARRKVLEMMYSPRQLFIRRKMRSTRRMRSMRRNVTEPAWPARRADKTISKVVNETIVPSSICEQRVECGVNT